MQTKFILHIGADDYELREDDLKNWGDVKCSYKREDYGGVVRSFTSQFQFVNHAKELLQELYLSERFNAKASISVHTLTNSWGYEKRFECELDFSTISWEGGVLGINAIDNSLSAMIKANKGTKYEFLIGTDIIRDDILSFDRIPMKESLTYELTQGSQSADSAVITVSFKNDELPYIGVVGKEITINQVLDWNDDQTNSLSSYLVKSKVDTVVNVQCELEWYGLYSYSYNSENYQNRGALLSARIRRNGALLDCTDLNDGNGGTFATLQLDAVNRIYPESGNEFTSPSQLPDPSTLTHPGGAYAIVNGIIWTTYYRGTYVWQNTGKTSIEECYIKKTTISFPLHLKAGDEVLISSSISSGITVVSVPIIISKFTFEWMGTGSVTNIDVFTPQNVARKLLNKMADGSVNVEVDISGYDRRIPCTYLISAERARAIPNARLYTSFSEFCDWMSAVFGYVWYVGEITPPRFKGIRECGQYEYPPWHTDLVRWSGDVEEENIIYLAGYGKFMYHEPGTSNLYPNFNGMDDYNDPETGYARTDTLFRIKQLSGDELYYFDEYEGGYMTPIVYDLPIDNIGFNTQTVHFVHRDEFFDSHGNVRTLGECANFSYSVDTSAIYSAVTAGYDKKDYESINGRDEFNFFNTYETGCTVSDKTLSLISKYRADCYGIEFAIQKQGEDSTDSASDKDVFFALCTKQLGKLVPDRTMEVTNAISDQVFNAGFSPMACIRANAGLIGLQADELTLRFASSTGNSDIIINEEPMSTDIILSSPIATCGVLEFESYETFDEGYANDLFEVEHDGLRYRGFLKETDTMYARTETTKYKLIIKDITPCS